jgi:hypothetical protein
MIKSGWIKWAEHVACMGDMRNAYKILIGRKGKVLEDLSVGGMLMSKSVLKK